MEAVDMNHTDNPARARWKLLRALAGMSSFLLPEHQNTPRLAFFSQGGVLKDSSHKTSHYFAGSVLPRKD
ncbi:hypothetical protein PAMP_003582 [Pampus punctatissimus]